MSSSQESSSFGDSSSMSQRYRHAQSLVDSAPDQAIPILCELQEQVASLSLFSSNESVDDVSTKSLPLLAIDYALALAHLHVPTSPGKAVERKQRVEQSHALFGAFLHTLEELEVLNSQQTREYHALLDADGDDESLSISRDEKIARFRAKQLLQKQVERLESLQQRRGRLGIEPQEELDGLDAESLERKVAITTLSIAATEAIDEWQQSQRELPMIDMMIQMDKERADRQRHAGPSTHEQDRRENDPRPPPTNKPFQLTHISKDSMTGQLQVRKEELQSQVFRPGWNQPTMTLQELGEREVAEAQEREARQKQSKAGQKNAPRRYDQLVRDGMEDDADLVDASAKLDRDWDEFRAQNPRGSGNKMGDRGDRNF